MRKKEDKTDIIEGGTITKIVQGTEEKKREEKGKCSHHKPKSTSREVPLKKLVNGNPKETKAQNEGTAKRRETHMKR